MEESVRTLKEAVLVSEYSDASMEIAEKLEGNTEMKLFLYNGYGHAAFDTAEDYLMRIKSFLDR